MMCKFLKLPFKEASVALAYVAGPVDAKGVPHDQVTLMRGVPADFVRVADGLTFREKYKSFIASWSPGDAPDPEQMVRVIESLERLLFGDLDPSRFSYVIYEHRTADRVDLHALIAGVELTSGLSFNAAPPRWQGSFDAWRDMHNAREGWASPADPSLARMVQPGAQPQFKNARARQGKATPASLKAEMHAYALDLVNSGLIGSREALIDALATHGTVKRVNPDFISVIPPELGKPIRLRGTIFTEAFDFAAAVKHGPAPAPGPRPSRTAKDHDADRDPVAEERARKRFEAAVGRRNKHNIERFAPRRRRVLVKEQDAVKQPDPGRKPEHQDVPKDEPAPAPMDLGIDQVANEPASTPGRMAPQLLLPGPTRINNDTTSSNIRDNQHDRPNRTATSTGIAGLVRGLRDRFEQLTQRIAELGASLRRKRWLHEARFDIDRRAHRSAGVPAPGDGAAPVEEAPVKKPLGPRSKP